MADSTMQATEAQAVRAQAIKALEEAIEEAAKACAATVDYTPLERYVKAGEACLKAIEAGRTNMRAEAVESKRPEPVFDNADFDDQCNMIVTKMRMTYPHLFRAKSDTDKSGNVKRSKERNEYHVNEYVYAACMVKLMEGLVTREEALGLSWHLLRNYLFPLCLTFKKASLEFSWKGATGESNPWADTIKSGVAGIVTGETNAVGDFIKALQAKSAEINKPRSVKEVSEEELARKQLAKDRAKAVEGTLNSVSEAVDVLGPQETIAQVAKALSDRGMEIGQYVGSGFDPATASLADWNQAFQLLYNTRDVERIKGVIRLAAILAERLKVDQKAVEMLGQSAERVEPQLAATGTDG
jgi:hypothetical protein